MKRRGTRLVSSQPAPTVRSITRAAAYSSLASAADAMKGPGELVLEQGATYRVTRDAETIKLRNGTRVIGKPGAKVCGVAYGLISASNVSNVHLEGFELSMAATQNFRKWFAAENVDGITMRHMVLRDTGGMASTGWTNMGTYFSRCRNIVVEDCEMVGTQLKLSGPGGCSGVTVRRSRFVRALQYAISFVIAEPEQCSRGFLVEDCEILDPPGNGGIYVGDDSAAVNARGRCIEITIRRTRIGGTWVDRANTSGIHGRLCAFNANWMIVDNVINPVNRAERSSGIVILERDGGGQINDLVITGNTIINVDSWGIGLDGGLQRALIQNNRLDTTRGIGITGRTVPSTDIRVVSNDVHGGSYGLYVDGIRGRVTAEHAGNRFTKVKEPIRVIGEATLIDRGPLPSA